MIDEGLAIAQIAAILYPWCCKVYSAKSGKATKQAVKLARELIAEAEKQ